ncbi:MAG: hypothetical protein GY730_07765 [bacterium]|nr:hypothetical protein [bacterium]
MDLNLKFYKIEGLAIFIIITYLFLVFFTNIIVNYLSYNLIGILIGLISPLFLLWIYNDWGWKHIYIQFNKLIIKNYIDISGSYSGTINSSCKGDILCEVEICQKASLVSVTLKTKKEDDENDTVSRSYMEDLRIEGNGDLKLSFMYSNKGNDSDKLCPHQGFNELCFHKENDYKKFDGTYFTNRQTKGTIAGGKKED